MANEGEDYLGDGLYVLLNGVDIKLRAPRDNGNDEVYIDKDMYYRLKQMVEERYGWK